MRVITIGKYASIRWGSTPTPQARTIACMAVVTIWVCAAVSLKTLAAASGAFTSDLYDHYQSLIRTADGAFFPSFVWGRIMGEHGYLVYLILAPLFWIGPSAGFWVLVAAAPIVFGACSAGIYVILSKRNRPAPMLASALFLLVPGAFWVAQDPTYGFHPDTLAGPLLVVSAVGFASMSQRERDVGDVIGMGAFAVFSLLKQEMALLALAMAFPFVLQPVHRRFGVRLTVLAAAVVLASFSVMHLAWTPFNRKIPSDLFHFAIGRIIPWAGLTNALPTLLPPMAAGVIVLIIWLTRRYSDPAVQGFALVVAGKLAALPLIIDGLPWFSWHLSIFVFATWFALWRLLDSYQPTLHLAACKIIPIAGLLMITAGLDGLWLVRYPSKIAPKRLNASEAATARAAFSSFIDGGVVSIPPFDWHAWRDHPAVVTPRGLTASPKGISDAVVTGAEGLSAELGAFHDCLIERARTTSRRLYVRASTCPFSEERELFQKWIGLPHIKPSPG